MIAKKNRIIKKPEFDIEFEYQETDGVGWITVRRLSGKDILLTIRFGIKDRLKTSEQFRHICTCWCDRNVA